MVERPRRASQLARATVPAAATDGAGVILGRRPARAGTRAVVGGGLVAVALILVFALVLSAARTHLSSYQVAAVPLPAGTTIVAADLTAAKMDLSGATRTAAFGQSSSLVGRTLDVAVAPGTLIESSMLAAPGGTDLRPVSIAVDANSLVALATGQSVDVLTAASVTGTASATGTPSGAGTASSSAAGTATGTSPAVTVVMRGATLLSIDRSATGGLSASDDSATVVVTLGVNTLDEAEQLVAAEGDGTIELIQAEPSDGNGLGAG